MLSRANVGGSMAAKSLLGFQWEGSNVENTGPVGYSDTSVILSRDFGNMPSPMNFDQFIPWVAKEMELEENVTIKRVVVEDYVPQTSSRRKTKRKSRNLSTLPSAMGTSQMTGMHHGQDRFKSTAQHRPSKDLVSMYELLYNVVPITTYYNPRERLIAVTITANEYLSQKLIKAIDLVLPFHPELAKITVTKGSVKQEVIYEIGEILKFSNITEVCLDNTYVRQGNYYALLDNSHLKRLSLNRCCINDVIVEEITTRLKHDSRVSKTLQFLELSSNYITDLGAYMIGNLLRRNRQLVHLNLAGNRLTDDGAEHILDQLKKFRLTAREYEYTSRRKRIYYKKKVEIYDQCYAEMLRKQKKRMESISSSMTGHAHKARKSVAPRPKPGKINWNEVKEAAEAKTELIMGGPFKDAFDENHVIRIDNVDFCTGNFRLCSINLAYNSLEFLTVKKVLEVVKYQRSACYVSPETGLLRIILDGNYMPKASSELEAINSILTEIVYERSPERVRRKLSETSFRPTFDI